MLVAARRDGFTNIPSIRDAGISIAALEKLADADAFNSIGSDRRKALWEVSALSDRPKGMFQGQDNESARKQVDLPEMTLPEHVVQDYAAIALSLKAHPVSFIRSKLPYYQATPTKDLSKIQPGTTVRVAGLVLVRQRPGTAGGVCFIIVEDETGVANLVVFRQLFEKYRKEILDSRPLMVEGKLQREGDVIVKHCYNLTALFGNLNGPDSTSLQTLSRADEKDGNVFPTAKNTKKQVRKVVQGEIFPKGRNFK